MDAKKTRFGAGDLADLFADATKLIVAKGKKVVTFDPRKDDASEVAAAVLGPSGNLRAPAIRTGKTWLIGFSEDAYGERLG